MSSLDRELSSLQPQKKSLSNLDWLKDSETIEVSNVNNPNNQYGKIMEQHAYNRAEEQQKAIFNIFAQMNAAGYTIDKVLEILAALPEDVRENNKSLIAGLVNASASSQNSKQFLNAAFDKHVTSESGLAFARENIEPQVSVDKEFADVNVNYASTMQKIEITDKHDAVKLALEISSTETPTDDFEITAGTPPAWLVDPTPSEGTEADSYFDEATQDQIELEQSSSQRDFNLMRDGEINVEF